MLTLSLLALAALFFLLYHAVPAMLAFLGWLFQLALSLGLYIIVILGAVYLLCWVA